jgi:hypothetical protein
MQITLTPQTLITASAVLAAVAAIATWLAKGVRWVDRQKAQDTELKALSERHNHDMESMNKELTLLVYGNLACLKGLKEQGCNGPVTEAINKIEKHLNEKAHQ